jgi:long-chain acyl-CoA synthetase
MKEKLWHRHKWPEGVAHDIGGYDRPLFSLLDDTAEKYPDLVYTIFEGATRTFTQVRDTANRIAGFLASRGIEKGDRVGIFMPNIPHYPPALFGILKAGAAAVTCNPLYKTNELNYQLKDVGAKAVFVMDHPEFYQTAAKAIEGTDVDTVVICSVKSQLPVLKGLIGGLLGKIPRARSYHPGHFFFDEIVRGADPNPPDIQINPTEDLAVVIYTGGTTGAPKGAALTHSNFVYDVMALYEYIRMRHEPGGKPETLRFGGFHTWLGVLPWYHSFGLTICLLGAAFSGSRLICVPDPRAGNPPFTKVLDAVQRYKATALVGVPTIYVAFMNHPLLSKFDLTSLMACGSGGAPMPVEVIKRFEEITGGVIFEGYGLSETTPVATLNPTNPEQRKVGSVGFPFPGTDIKIVDLEDPTKELPQGQDGEIVIHGPQVMQGYWGRPEENENVFKDIGGKRFFLTGDIGHYDEEGFLVITDRKKDLILVGGFNVYPRDVEEILYRHPKVAMAAAIGVPDEKSGEVVKAFVQLKPGESATEDEIKAFSKEHLTGYKRPRYIEFRDSLPTSPIGKVLRRELRDEERAKQKP